MIPRPLTAGLPHGGPTGKGCLYVKRLEDLDRDVLTEMIERAWQENHTAG